MRAPGDAAADAFLVRPRPLVAPARRLVCLHAAGGSALSFRTWPSLLPPDMEVLAIELPGRGRRRREAPVDDLVALVEALTDALAPWLDRPYAVFGHSMGALLGFELARALVGSGAPPPELLVVAGHPAPHLERRSPPLHPLGRTQLITALAAMGGTPAPVLACDELIDAMLPAIRADLAVCERFRSPPAPRLACPVVALAGHDDRVAPPNSMGAWAEVTGTPFELQVVPGGHFFVTARAAAVCALLADRFPLRSRPFLPVTTHQL